MRERADEMAALLDEAAPRAARTRRRRSTAVPAAVAAFGALSIGGVGLALGLTPTGVEGVLPASPSPALADPASVSPPTSPDGPGASAPTEGDVADPAVAGADLIRPDDHGDHGGPDDRTDAPGEHSSTPPSSTTQPPRPTSSRPTPTTSRHRPTSSRPSPTSTRSASPRSTSTRPSTTRSSSAPRAVAQRSSLHPSSEKLHPSSEKAADPTTAPSSSRHGGGAPEG